jgi:hypothetical protein
MTISKVYLVILLHFIVVAVVRCQICSSDTTLTLMDDETPVFSVDKTTQTTTVVQLNAEKCNCDTIDVSSTIIKLQEGIDNLTAQLLTLSTIIDTTPTRKI